MIFLDQNFSTAKITKLHTSQHKISIQLNEFPTTISAILSGFKPKRLKGELLNQNILN